MPVPKKYDCISPKEAFMQGQIMDYQLIHTGVKRGNRVAIFA